MYNRPYDNRKYYIIKMFNNHIPIMRRLFISITKNISKTKLGTKNTLSLSIFNLLFL